MNYVCNVLVEGGACGFTVPADSVGAALMQAHLHESHDFAPPLSSHYKPTAEDPRASHYAPLHVGERDS